MPGAMRTIRMTKHADGYMAGEVVEVSQSKARRLIAMGCAVDMDGAGPFGAEANKMASPTNVK